MLSPKRDFYKFYKLSGNKKSELTLFFYVSSPVVKTLTVLKLYYIIKAVRLRVSRFLEFKITHIEGENHGERKRHGCIRMV